MMDDRINIAIIGGGAIGCAVAYELSKEHEGIYLFEKTPFLADGQSGRNSGVIHSGIYYKEGSLKSQFCVTGNKRLYEFCEKNKVLHKKTGKLIVATNRIEKKILEFLLELSKKNNTPDVYSVGRKAIETIEPNVNAISSLYCGTTGIIDAAAYVNKLAGIAELNGASILKKTEVTGISAKKDYFTLKTSSRGDIDSNYVINAAGLYSDNIASMVNPENKYEIQPIRGEYYSFQQKKGIEVNGNIYPAPKPDTVGIHLTPTFDNGKIIVGPTAINIKRKDDYENKRQTAEYFYNAVKDFFPNLEKQDLKIDFAGIRAKPKDNYDFIIKRDDKYPKCIHLIGIDSPGLTCSLAIADYVKEMFFS